ncbi:MAG: MerR family transcriptional regulator [Bacteroidota bacterium]
MLMHEWRQYRERQIRKVVKEAREAEDLAPEQAAELEQATSAPEASAGAELQELKSAPGQPRKELMERLATNQVVVEKIQNYSARQQMLPLDVETAPAPAKTGKAVESREQLVQRLLDPVLSLEEAAILLNVCPTTVRRYTNRGVLKCDRTPGNQRRFRLSEIMSFMERRQMGEE